MAQQPPARGRITPQGKTITGDSKRRLKGRITREGEIVDESESEPLDEYLDWHDEAKKDQPIPPRQVPEGKRLPLHRMFPAKTRKQI